MIKKLRQIFDDFREKRKSRVVVYPIEGDFEFAEALHPKHFKSLRAVQIAGTGGDRKTYTLWKGKDDTSNWEFEKQLKEAIEHQLKCAVSAENAVNRKWEGDQVIFRGTFPWFRAIVTLLIAVASAVCGWLLKSQEFFESIGFLSREPAVVLLNNHRPANYFQGQDFGNDLVKLAVKTTGDKTKIEIEHVELHRLDDPRSPPREMKLAQDSMTFPDLAPNDSVAVRLAETAATVGEFEATVRYRAQSGLPGNWKSFDASRGFTVWPPNLTYGERGPYPDSATSCRMVVKVSVGNGYPNGVFGEAHLERKEGLAVTFQGVEIVDDDDRNMRSGDPSPGPASIAWETKPIDDFTKLRLSLELRSREPVVWGEIVNQVKLSYRER